NGNGSYTFTPAANYDGAVPVVSYTTNTGATADLTITINPIDDAPSAVNSAVTTNEDSTYTYKLTDFHFTDVDSSVITAIRIDSLPVLGDLYYNGTIVTATGMVITVANIGLLTFHPDLNQSGSNQYATAGIGDQKLDYANFHFSVSDGTLWSTSSGTMTVDVIAVADAPTVSINGTAVVTQIINVTNATSTTNGFTITAYNANGSSGTISTHTSAPAGFGVTGDVAGGSNRGDSTEIQYDTTLNASEKIDIKFDNALSSVSVSFAWHNSTETVGANYYLNGTLVGNTTNYGGTDGVDPVIAMSPSNGSLFNEIVFYAPNAGDDYLINSLIFDKQVSSTSSVTTDDTRSVLLNVATALTDTDGSEALTTRISGIPAGFYLTDGVHEMVSIGSTINVSGWTLSSLKLTAPENVVGTVNLTVTSTSTEISNGSSASTSASITVVVAAEAALSAVADNVITDAGNTTFTIPEWALLYNDTSADNLSAVSNSTGLSTLTATASGDVTAKDHGPAGGSFTYTVDDSVLNLSTNTTTTTHGTADVAISQDTSGSLDAKAGENDILISNSSTATTLNGNTGNDILIGQAGVANTLNGNAGNDVMLYDANDIKIDGGTGTDTLVLQSSANIDFSILDSTKVHNIEVIDLNINGNHTISNLKLSDVLNMTDSNHTLEILGNSTDTVSLKNGTGTDVWTKSATQTTDTSGHTFDVYTNSANSSVSVKVEDHTTHNII
ncbi:MAG: Ig-like domain-containing protein, partial [Thiovulaceae bacterium]|nr:Ig-like domain-containing protein [Sulfurimonadaceae bacterium]